MASATDTMLERDGALIALQDSLAAARSAGGRIALVSGQAGIGKTTVVRAFAAQRGEIRVLWGGCDALFTPRPLGAVHDIAREVGGRLLEQLEGGTDRTTLLASLLAELVTLPSLVVFEDVHWADEATLDALTYVGRRIDSSHSLLVLTFRDDELGPRHPLRLTLEGLPAAATVRVQLAPLSEAAVGELALRAGRPAKRLHATTGGNPFFVTEVLAGGDAEIPSTVRDAVLARAARVSETARGILEAAAIVPEQTEIWLLEALVGSVASACFDECIASGMLVATSRGLGFRHELARLAVEASLAPGRKAMLHERALAVLAEPPTGMLDLAALAHHADAAHNTDAVLRFAPAAGERAAALGSHREAAAQYARALRHAGGRSADERVALLEAYAEEAHLTGDFETSIAARQETIAVCGQLGDALRTGVNLARLTLPYVALGLNSDAENASRTAITVLEGLPESSELGVAYAHQSYVRMLGRDNADGVHWGEHALALATRFGDLETRAMALNLVGTSRLMAGEIARGREDLERSLALSRELGLDVRVASAFSMLGTGLGEMYELEPAEQFLREHIALARERDLDASYTSSWLAATLVYRGRWDEGVELARVVLTDTSNVTSRITALIALGRVRARRGDPGVGEVLDEALELARVGGHLQRLGHVRSARAEAACLAGDNERAIAEARSAYGLAVEKRHLWFAGELAYWQSRSGAPIPAPDWIAEPYRLQLAGDLRGAALAWSARGCPYEAARALGEADDPDTLREALVAFELLGAGPLERSVRAALRQRGARGVPRGPRAATRGTPGGLTRREVDVLHLVATGLTDAEIAGRLVLSRRTVEHHVAAIRRKLGAHTRGEATATAARLGLIQDR